MPSLTEIGLTGGIGSGKSTVARIFETLGYQVYYADDRAKALYTEDPAVRKAVEKLFGKDIYTADGTLDRARLAGIVFNDPEQLKALNAIVHPATRRDFATWRSEMAKGYAKPFLLKEAAILFEAGTAADMEAVISVYAPKSIRLARVCARDGVQPEQVLARMDKQWPEARKLQKADFIIYNDGTHPVIPQVMAAIDFFS